MKKENYAESLLHLSQEGAKSSHLTHTAKELHQLLLGHVVEHVLQVAIVTAATTALVSRRRIVEQLVDTPAVLVVLLGLRLLHPKEHAARRGLELEHKNSSSFALINTLVLEVIGKDNQIVLHLAGGAVLPAEVHQAVVALSHVDQTLARIRMDHLANHIHASGAELHQVAAVAGTAQSTLSAEHDAGAS